MKSAHYWSPVTLCSLWSQASESGSADDTQSQVLEWQEMVADAVSARDRAKEEKATMALRISHMEEEREGKAVAGGWHKLMWTDRMKVESTGSDVYHH